MRKTFWKVCAHRANTAHGQDRPTGQILSQRWVDLEQQVGREHASLPQFTSLDPGAVPGSR